MKAQNADCRRFELLLADLLDGELQEERAFAEEHLSACASCAALEADLRAIRTDAMRLAPLAPSRDLWPAIEQRIQAEVIALGAPGGDRGTKDQGQADAAPPKRAVVTVERRVLLLAAASVVIFAAGATYAVTRAMDARRSGNIATAQLVGGGSALESVSPALPADDPRYATMTAVAASYGDQIGTLQAVLGSRVTKLDTGTVAVIRRNMIVIDDAIRESVQALARDPSSQFLLDRYRSALDAKVGLLRTAVMIPATTN